MASSTFAHLKTLRLSTSIFNANLIERIHKIWFANGSIADSVPTLKNKGDWFGLDRTPEEKVAFDDHLRDDFGEALQALGPSSYPLPPATTASEERANAGIISLPFRRLDMLKIRDGDEKAKTGLGIILLLDQISRNIFRTQEGQAVVYSHYDRISRALLHSMLIPDLVDTHRDANGEDLADLAGLGQTGPIRHSIMRQAFLLMPLMHSEDLRDHDELVRQSNRLKDEARAKGDKEGLEYLNQLDEFEQKHRVILEQFGRYAYRNDCLGRRCTPEERKYLNEGGERFSAAA